MLAEVGAIEKVANDLQVLRFLGQVVLQDRFDQRPRFLDFQHDVRRFGQKAQRILVRGTYVGADQDQGDGEGEELAHGWPLANRVSGSMLWSLPNLGGWCFRKYACDSPRPESSLLQVQFE